MANRITLDDIDHELDELAKHGVTGGRVRAASSKRWKNSTTTTSKVGRRFIRGKWKTKYNVSNHALPR